MGIFLCEKRGELVKKVRVGEGGESSLMWAYAFLEIAKKNWLANQPATYYQPPTNVQN